MSILSDVRLTCLVSDYTRLVATYRNKVKGIAKGNPILFDDIQPTSRIVQNMNDPEPEPTVVCGWESIRWYDDDPTIQAFTEAMAEIFDADEHPVSFARVDNTVDSYESYVEDDNGRLACHVSAEMTIVEW